MGNPLEILDILGVEKSELWIKTPQEKMETVSVISHQNNAILSYSKNEWVTLTLGYDFEIVKWQTN